MAKKYQKRLSLRLTKGDKKSIEAQARRCGWSVSEYVRNLHERAQKGFAEVEDQLHNLFFLANDEADAEEQMRKIAREKGVLISEPFFFADDTSEPKPVKSEPRPVQRTKPRQLSIFSAESQIDA